MLAKVLTFTTLLSLGLLVFVLLQTNPVDAGPFGVLAVFVFLYVSLIGVATLFLLSVNRGLILILKSVSFRRLPAKIEVRKAYYFGTILALVPVMLIALQSVGAVSWYEIFLVCIFLAIGVLYVSKRM